MTEEHLTALKQLRSNQEVIILQPDKGSGVVLLNKLEYIEKMQTILNDQTKFQKASKQEDPVCIERKICKEIQKLVKRKLISTDTAKSLKPRGTQLPQLYGLPKLHKPDIPMRPILSMSNSPQHKLAKWLAEILQPLQKSLSVHTLRDSFQLSREISDLNIAERHLASMDITSLFTNVPLRQTVDFICGYAKEYSMDLGLPNADLKRLILLCTENIAFNFQGTCYKQIDGVAMGSPLGPILADIFVAHLEKKIETAIHSVEFYRRYVDDIFVVTDSPERTETLLQLFNSLHTNIKLSIEHESNGCLPFLDVHMRRRNDGTIQRSVHRKHTWTGQYLHFTSFVPMHYKRGLVKSLYHRAHEICSEDTLKCELDTIEKTLQANGYPEAFIKKNCSR